MTRLVLVLVAVAALLGLAAPGTASCAGPSLTVPGAPTAPPQVSATDVRQVVRLPAGARVEVLGGPFLDGCDDTGSVHTGGGCAGRREQRTVVHPLRDVRLTLFQGPRAVDLGGTDATGPEAAARWSVVLPPDLAAGPALLEAGGARLLVEVEPAARR